MVIMVDRRGGRGGRGGFNRGGFNRGGGGGGGRGGRQEDFGPPDHVVESGTMMHPCEDMIVLKATNKDTVPFFNAPIYLENKQQVGKVDEIFGPIRDYVNILAYLLKRLIMSMILIVIIYFF
jgi:H/ACA ribonucleoprotein complex subunit 1